MKRPPEKRRIGIAPTEEGARHAYAEVSPRVEYRTTELARTPILHLEAFIAWALTHKDDVMTSRGGGA